VGGVGGFSSFQKNLQVFKKKVFQKKSFQKNFQKLKKKFLKKNLKKFSKTFLKTKEWRGSVQHSSIGAEIRF
jgi:hypothetical protein